MHQTALSPEDVAETAPPAIAPRREHLEHVIQHAGHLLPAQGPITVFIHHNTLHAFEDLKFDEGVQKGARVYGCQPYLLEEQYRDRLSKGRIRLEDLEAELREDLGPAADDSVNGLGTRFDLRLAMLQFPLRVAPDAELKWFVAETDALRTFRPETPAVFRQKVLQETRRWVMRDVRSTVPSQSRETDGQERRIRAAMASLLEHFGEASIENWNDVTWEAFALQTLWRVCRDGVHGLPAFVSPPPLPVRHRDLLLEVTGVDSDELVHDVLIRFCAAFLDQGFSHWPLPNRELGMLGCFCELYRIGGGPPELWMHGLTDETSRIRAANVSPADVILESLERLGVAEDEWEEFIVATLLALRGWAGMIQQMEQRADRVAIPAPPGSVLEFLALRLLLDRLALAHVAREAFDAPVPLECLRDSLRRRIPRREVPSVDERAFLVFQLAQVRGWLPADLFRLSKSDWSKLVQEIETFSSLERRRVFHHAFERRYRNQALDAYSIHGSKPSSRVPNPRFQVCCCLDEREESFRRHLEEISPDVETCSVAGFFSVPMYFRGAADATFIPLCPVIIRPRHWVEENVREEFDTEHRRRAQTRKVLGQASHQVHVRSRTLWGGVLLAAFGAFASIPLVVRVLFPRLAAKVRRQAASFVRPPSQTQLKLERTAPEPGPEYDRLGFSVPEMTDIVERVLRDMGLTSNFARLVLMLGHGSNSLNNPHKSAYDCGACGGGHGAANARAWSQMANDARVRDGLKARGLEIPATTAFVGGFHNTCDDTVTYFDLDRLPDSHRADFDAARATIDRTCDRNAHERCRRFMSAPLDMSFSEAHRHVEARAEDLAQPRPECGHATNAICYVGRRQRTRGLYLDRRTFLTSYDPTGDDETYTILTRILSAAVPVCAGINLEYYFSYVDSPGFGCGTKLPHNVASLLGVMDGAASDLRPGLPWQMVEIHEPVRLLFIVENTPEAMTYIMDRFPVIGQTIRNEWVQLACLDPHSGQIQHYRNGRFEPYVRETDTLPAVPSSADWYRGWRDHLEFAEIEPAGSGPERPGVDFGPGSPISRV